MEKETQCILDRYNLTKLIVANYYFSAYGVFPVVDNLYYQYSQFIDTNSLNLASDEFALVQNYTGNFNETWSFGSIPFDVVPQNQITGVLLNRVSSGGGWFFIHVFKYV